MGPLSAIRIDAIRLRNLMDKDAMLGFEVLKRFLKIMDDRLESKAQTSLPIRISILNRSMEDPVLSGRFRGIHDMVCVFDH